MSPFVSLFKTLGRKNASFAYPGLEQADRVYVVGDIHGRLDCLIKAHATIDRDRRESPTAGTTEIYLGDYIDRGPESCGVIACLLARRSDVETVFLRGNHEAMFERFLDGEIPFEAWRKVGGAETLASYGLDRRNLTKDYRLSKDVAATLVPQNHRAFLRELKTFHVVGPYCFVHAGLRPNVALAQQTDDDLTGIRSRFLDHKDSFGFVVVHGHTPVVEVDFQPNRINIDTGAYATHRLSVLKITAKGASLLRPPGQPQ